LAVIALSVFLDTDGDNNNAIKNVLVNILKNPLIWGVLIGIVAVLIRQIQNSLFGSVIFSIKGNLKFLYSAMNQIKSLTTPLSLIVLGGQFTFSAVKALRREIVSGTLMRTVVAPFIGIGCAVILAATTSFHCDSDMYPALVALFGSPVAVSSAVMAGAMGNDEQLAGQLVVWTSIASIFTIFVQVCLLMYLGLIVV
jgi:predicted permease